MKITAFLGNQSYIDHLTADLQNEEGEFFLVCAEYERPGHTNDKLSDFKGLDVALTLNPEEAPIILCSFMDEKYFTENFSDKFHALMAKKRVCFVRLPYVFTPKQWLDKYQELLKDNKEEDTLAIEINRINSFEQEMGHIQHRVQSCFRDDSIYAKEQIANAVVEARGIGATGSDEEIALQIRDFKRQPKNSILAGKFFPGVFCDIENTLIVDGKVNTSMLTTLQTFSLSKPITLWTGGKVEDLQKILTQNEIIWKLISKTDLTGATVEIAYDDEEYSVFFEKYGIKVNEFRKI